MTLCTIQLCPKQHSMIHARGSLTGTQLTMNNQSSTVLARSYKPHTSAIQFYSIPIYCHYCLEIGRFVRQGGAVSFQPHSPLLTVRILSVQCYLISFHLFIYYLTRLISSNVWGCQPMAARTLLSARILSVQFYFKLFFSSL